MFLATNLVRKLVPRTRPILSQVYQCTISIGHYLPVPCLRRFFSRLFRNSLFFPVQLSRFDSEKSRGEKSDLRCFPSALPENIAVSKMARNIRAPGLGWCIRKKSLPCVLWLIGKYKFIWLTQIKSAKD